MDFTRQDSLSGVVPSLDRIRALQQRPPPQPSPHCDRTRRVVGLVISRRRHGRAVVYYTNVTDSPG